MAMALKKNQERMKESRESLAQTRSGIELHVWRSPADALEACLPRQSVERGTSSWDRVEPSLKTHE
jgi:hypothetical protein